MAESSARRWWALVAIAASVLVVGLDLTVLNLALPTIANDLHASTSDLQWFSDAYSLVLAAAMLPAGLLGDKFGRKKVLLIALVLFGASSAAWQKAIAIMASATFISFPIGPIVGGYLLDHFWWGSVFLINVPIVVGVLVAVVFLLPESRSDQRPRLDIAAGAAVLAAFVAWERRLTQRGAAADAGVPGDRHGGRAPGATGIRPLIELRLFRSVGFTWGTALATLVSFAMFGILFAMPQYFQEVRGVNAMGSGLRLLPMIGGMVIGMIGGTRLASARRAADDEAPLAPLASVKLLVTVGFTLMACTLAAGAMTKTTSGTGFAAAWFAVFGLGLGIAMPQTMNAALSALSAERSGSGSALISALRQVGATIGVAVLGTVLDSVYRSHLVVTGLLAATAAATRNSVVGGVQVAHALHSAPLHSAPLLDSARGSFVHGMDAMLWACGGIALVAAILALLFLPCRNDGMPAVPVADGTRPAATGETGAQRAQLEV